MLTDEDFAREVREYHNNLLPLEWSPTEYDYEVALNGTAWFYDLNPDDVQFILDP